MIERQDSSKAQFWGKVVLGVLAVGLSSVALAATSGDPTIATVATTVTSNFSAVAQLITASAYICGLGFFVGAILKFKQHKDNPTQIPIGTPIAMLFVAAALVFLPTIFGITGESVFGTGKKAGTSLGVDPFPSTGGGAGAGGGAGGGQ